ncbi:hypothetical protein CR513_02331, partial [Mucuna pruriens]
MTNNKAKSTSFGAKFFSYGQNQVKLKIKKDQEIKVMKGNEKAMIQKKTTHFEEKRTNLSQFSQGQKHTMPNLLDQKPK